MACSLPKLAKVIAIYIVLVVVRWGAISVNLVTENVILHKLEPILVMSPNNTGIVFLAVNAAYGIRFSWVETGFEIHFINFCEITSWGKEYGSLTQPVVDQVYGCLPMVISAHISGCQEFI